MRVANNVEMLELEAILANGPGVINPLIIWDENDVVLFDAGLPGMGKIIRETAADASVPFKKAKQNINYPFRYGSYRKSFTNH